MDFFNKKPQKIVKTNSAYIYANTTAIHRLSALHFDFPGHEPMNSNAGRFKPPFAVRDKKQTMIDPRGISTNWFKGIFQPFKLGGETKLI